MNRKNCKTPDFTLSWQQYWHNFIEDKDVAREGEAATTEECHVKLFDALAIHL